ncbi:hypothetical protein BgiMline_032077 [Biomphalaria glabrata]
MFCMANGMKSTRDRRKAWNIPTVKKALYAVICSPVKVKAVNVAYRITLADAKNGARMSAWCRLAEPTSLASLLEMLQWKPEALIKIQDGTSLIRR